jgi:hypothetical protein
VFSLLPSPNCKKLPLLPVISSFCKNIQVHTVAHCGLLEGC